MISGFLFGEFARRYQRVSIQPYIPSVGRTGRPVIMSYIFWLTGPLLVLVEHQCVVLVSHHTRPVR